MFKNVRLHMLIVYQLAGALRRAGERQLTEWLEAGMLSHAVVPGGGLAECAAAHDLVGLGWTSWARLVLDNLTGRARASLPVGRRPRATTGPLWGGHADDTIPERHGTVDVAAISITEKLFRGAVGAARRRWRSSTALPTQAGP